jgi:hypothetical protein
MYRRENRAQREAREAANKKFDEENPHFYDMPDDYDDGNESEHITSEVIAAKKGKLHYRRLYS